MSGVNGTDEGLVRAYRLGNRGALTTLLKRYEPRLRNFILGFSWFKDASFIDDIIQEIFLTIFKELSRGKFTPSGAGSFKKWVYLVTKHHCFKASAKYRRQPKPLSERYPDKFPNDLLVSRPRTSTQIKNLERLDAKLAKVLKLLTPEERTLFRLMSRDKTYKEIKKIPPFNKYSLVNLRRKVCDLRKFVYEEVKKWSRTERS